MPANVTKMNIYAIRGPDYGVSVVPAEEKIYLGHYPDDVSESVDFHNLDIFGDIPAELSDTGYEFPTEFSQVWTDAMVEGGGDFR